MFSLDLVRYLSYGVESPVLNIDIELRTIKCLLIHIDDAL